MQTKGTTNVLFLSDTDRRTAFAHIDRFAPTRKLPASAKSYPLGTDMDKSLKGLSYTIDKKTSQLGAVSPNSS